MANVHFTNCPIEFIMPPSSNNVRDISIKIIPSATKPEIKRILELVHGCEVEKVRTLNMKGKKKMLGGRLVARPDYKKAYVTLKNPLSFSHSCPVHLVEDESKSINVKSKLASLRSEKSPSLDRKRVAL